MNQDVYSVLASAVGQTLVFHGASAPVKVASVHRSGLGVVVRATALNGEPVVRTVTSSASIVPGWAVRLASVLRLAWEAPQFDPIVKDLIRRAELPVDNDVNWDSSLRAIFKRGGFDKDPDLVDDLIQEMLVNVVMRRMLERFDPTAVDQGGLEPGYSDLPLEKKVTIYLRQVFNWQFKELLARKVNKNFRDPEAFSGDMEIGGRGALWDAVAPADSIPGADDLIEEIEDAQGLRDLRDAFSRYVSKHRDGDMPARIMTLFDIIVSVPNMASVKDAWEERTGQSYASMRKTLVVLREEMAHFAHFAARSNNLKAVDFLNDIRIRVHAPAPAAPEEEEAAEVVPSPVAEAVEEEEVPGPGRLGQTLRASSVGDHFKMDATKVATFLDGVEQEVRWAAAGLKTAKPKVVDTSVLYVVLEANQENHRVMNIRFGGPGIAKTPGAGTAYSIEVGTYGPDRSLPEKKIRKQLNALVFPSMRSDVPDQFHNLLEKVIRELRGLVWEHAVDFFDLPPEQKQTWKQTIRMDVLTLQDVKVNIADQGQTTTVEDAPEASKEIPMVASARFASLKRAAEEAPEAVATKLEEIKQKLLSDAEAVEALQSHLDMTDEAQEKFAGFKRAAEEEPEELEAAIQELFLSIDSTMGDIEQVADDLGVELPSGPVASEEEEESAEGDPAEISHTDPTAE